MLIETDACLRVLSNGRARLSEPLIQ